MPVIKQPSIYINLATDYYGYYEPYDHTLVVCGYDGCPSLCEKGVGTCDKCIDAITTEMAKDLEELTK